MSDKVYITRIDIQNIGGLEEFHAELGAINLVLGENGVGKSSVLNALEIVLGGGSDPDLIHNKHDHGEVTLTLSDGTTVHKSMERDGSADLRIRTRDGGAVRAPATYLKTLAAGMGFDPIGFLNSEPKDRAAFLLQNLPLSFTADEVNAALGSPLLTAPATLQRVNEIRQGKYDDRTKLKKDVRDLEGAIKDLRDALPKDDEKDWSAEVAKVQDAIGELDQRKASIAAQIELEAEQARNEKRQSIGVEIEELRKQITAKEAELAEFIATVDVAAVESLAEQTKAISDQRDPLVLDLSDAKANAEQHQRAAGIRDMIAARKRTLEGHNSEEMRLDKAIERLDKMKHAKLKELPIAGLDLKADSKGRPVILIDGIPIDKLNRQQQLYVAIQAVSLSAGRLPLILLEAAELDDAHVAELGEAAKDAGLQLVLARWKNNAPLEVVAA